MCSAQDIMSWGLPAHAHNSSQPLLITYNSPQLTQLQASHRRLYGPRLGRLQRPLLYVIHRLAVGCCKVRCTCFPPFLWQRLVRSCCPREGFYRVTENGNPVLQRRVSGLPATLAVGANDQEGRKQQRTGRCSRRRSAVLAAPPASPGLQLCPRYICVDERIRSIATQELWQRHQPTCEVGRRCLRTGGHNCDLRLIAQVQSLYMPF